MKLSIRTPSRLHFTLIDLNGRLGRIDGGLGVALKEPFNMIHFYGGISGLNRDKKRASDRLDTDKDTSFLVKTPIGDIFIDLTECRKTFTTESYETERLAGEISAVVGDIISRFAKKLVGKYPEVGKTPVALTVKPIEILESHIGLGSKTQISLALASGITRFLGINLPVEELTYLVGRGGTSGIGYRVFERGGFILDCGHKFGKGKEKESFLPSSASSAYPARTVLRYDFPEDWVFLLVKPAVKAGASNKEEINIFQRYCPIPLEEVRELSHIILMELLPGLIERELETFGDALARIRKIGFKKIEISLQHGSVRDLMNFMEKNGAPCVGMSSFGPTVFAVLDSDGAARRLAESVLTEFQKVRPVYLITHADNNGAEFKEE